METKIKQVAISLEANCSRLPQLHVLRLSFSSKSDLKCREQNQKGCHSRGLCYGPLRVQNHFKHSEGEQITGCLIRIVTVLVEEGLVSDYGYCPYAVT